ncbi:hypothetical protein GE061_007781 [Apolygus lucorum]|uniref:Uncharacterized protein n=1 Tax=Apolygus lucorum TaxID=248454 RepID=A0A6A4J326_APOLU|nr:hypothetical protein GE061_007781 [Apolygus lucorum]
MHSTTRASSLNVVLGYQFDGVAREDMKKIILSLLFPNQVLLNIQFEQSETGVSFICALCVLLLTNYSNDLRNITSSSRHSAELAIWRYLIAAGYSDPITSVRYGENVLETIRTPPRQMHSNFRNLHASGNDNRGGINTGCASWVAIGSPLYDGVTEMPAYGGMHDVLDIEAAGASACTPGLADVLNALRELKDVRSVESSIWVTWEHIRTRRPVPAPPPHRIQVATSLQHLKKHGSQLIWPSISNPYKKAHSTVD